MRPARLHIAAAYAVALLLFLSPLSESIVAIWPLHPGDTEWRFRALTVASRAVLTPALGFLILTAVAAFTDNRRMLRIAGWVACTFAVFLLIGCGLFLLDSLQMRARVIPANHRAYDVANLQALVKLAAGLVAAALLGLGSLATARANPLPAPRPKHATLIRD